MLEVFILCAKLCFDTPRHFEDIWENARGRQKMLTHCVAGGRVNLPVKCFKFELIFLLYEANCLKLHPKLYIFTGIFKSYRLVSFGALHAIRRHSGCLIYKKKLLVSLNGARPVFADVSVSCRGSWAIHRGL